MAAIFNLALGVTPESIDLWIFFPFWLKLFYREQGKLLHLWFWILNNKK